MRRPTRYLPATVGSTAIVMDVLSLQSYRTDAEIRRV